LFFIGEQLRRPVGGAIVELNVGTDRPATRVEIPTCLGDAATMYLRGDPPLLSGIDIRRRSCRMWVVIDPPLWWI
jgi:hypothetical protein